MKLTDIIGNILLEATPDEIYNSYYTDIPKDEFNQIVMADPISVSDETGLKRIGKYAKLLINMFRKKTLKIEDLPKAKEYLEYVYKHKISLDPNKIKTLNDLYDVVKGYYAKDTKDLNSIISALDEKEFRKVFQSENWSIFIPFTEKASCYLGVNTQWCTTWGPQSLDPKHKDRGSLFARYHSQGSLYIIISNSDVNEKYQFHFESKQYMDKDDRRIKITKFLNDNIDIKNFFYPSLVSDDVSEEIIKKQIDRLNALDEDDAGVLVNKIILKTSTNNPLILALVSKDEDKISELITDDDVYDLDINGENMTVEFKTSYGGSLRSTKDTHSYYYSEANSGYDMLWDRMNNEDTDFIKDTLEYYLEEYYKQNAEELRSSHGYQNYEQFKTDHYDNFVEDGDIWDEYSYAFVNKNTQNYESAAQVEVDTIEKYVDFDHSYSGKETVIIRIPYFLLFLVKKNYNKIDGVENYMIDVLDDYVSYYNIDNDYEGIWDYNEEGVTYEDIKNKIETYFEKVLEDNEGVKRCGELRNILGDIIRNVFKGGTYIENDEFILKIPSLKIDCDKESINIIYNNKKTGDRFSGPIKVENLAAFATNHKLFESVLNVKNLLK